MKALRLLSVLLLGFTLAARGDGISYSPFANGGNIPDGDVMGWFDTATASGFAGAITDVSVTLDLAGSFNGDLYAYLSHNSVVVPLLNRVGVTGTGGGNAFGYADTGFNITLSSSGANDVHFYGNHSPNFNGNGQLTGTWQPDGRDIEPLSSPESFDLSSFSRVSFDLYDDMSPNGDWELFIADLGSGGVQSQLLNWQLYIQAVPEPGSVALGVFAGAFFVVAGRCRAAWLRRRFPKAP